MELGEVMMLIGAVVLMLWITTIKIKKDTHDILLNNYLLEIGLFFLVIGYIIVYITGIALNLQGKFH